MYSVNDTSSKASSTSPDRAWVRYTGFRGGFPHSEICGSKVVRTSPQLIAAYHVRHRLLPPRHPRNALKSLDCSHYQCPLGSGIIDEEKTRSCEIDPITARLVQWLLRAVPGRTSGISLLHDVQDHHRSKDRSGKLVISSSYEKKMSKCWWSQTGSNRRPQACKASALPTELWPQLLSLVVARRKRSLRFGSRSP